MSDATNTTSPQRTLTAAAVAAALNVSEPTVGNWAKAGMPHDWGHGRTGRRTRFFNLDECRTWRQKHAPAAGSGREAVHGGVREGAGRRGGAPQMDKLPNGQMVKEEVSGQLRVVGGDDRAGSAPLPTGHSLLTTDNSPLADSWMSTAEGIIARLEKDGIGGADARALAESFRAVLTKIELDREMGKTWDADEARAIWARHMQTSRDLLDAMPGQCAAKIARAMGVTEQGKVGEIESVVRDGVTRVVEHLCKEPVGSRQ